MSQNNVSDAELIKLYKQGKEEAFEQLVNRHKVRIYNTIKQIVKDTYVAEDLLQETFVKVVNTIKSDSYNEEGKFLPWVMRIAHNLAVDRFRKNKRYPTVVMEDGANVFNTLAFSEESIEAQQVQEDTHALLKKLIQELPASQREVLTMRHYMELSFKEIAETTGVSINTALGRMRYALINLRKKMQSYNIAYDSNFYPN